MAGTGDHSMQGRPLGGRPAGRAQRRGHLCARTSYEARTPQTRVPSRGARLSFSAPSFFGRLENCSTTPRARRTNRFSTKVWQQATTTTTTTTTTRSSRGGDKAPHAPQTCNQRGDAFRWSLWRAAAQLHTRTTEAAMVLEAELNPPYLLLAEFCFDFGQLGGSVDGLCGAKDAGAGGIRRSVDVHVGAALLNVEFGASRRLAGGRGWRPVITTTACGPRAQHHAVSCLF